MACSLADAGQAWCVCAASCEVIWSRAAILIAAAALAPGEASKRIDGSAGIGMRIKPASSLGADATPLADQQRATKQQSLPSALHYCL
jgi:hypothetical protein